MSLNTILSGAGMVKIQMRYVRESDRPGLLKSACREAEIGSAAKSSPYSGLFVMMSFKLPL